MNVIHIDAIKYGNWKPVVHEDSIKNILPNLRKTNNRVVPEMGTDNGKRAALVGYSPSLKQSWEYIKDYGDVISCSGSHNFLLDKGIVPKYHVEIDPRPHKAKFIENPHKDVHYILSSAVPTETVNRLVDGGYQVSLFNLYVDPMFFMYPEDELVVSSPGFVGLHLLPFAYGKGYRRFGIFGMDCCYHGDSSHAGEHGGVRDSQLHVGFCKLDENRKATEPLRVFKTEYLWVVSALEWRRMLHEYFSDCHVETLCAGVLPEVLTHECILDTHRFTEKEHGSQLQERVSKLPV